MGPGGWFLGDPGPPLTLARCRLLARLPFQVLDVVQGDGPRGWLAVCGGFKHHLELLGADHVELRLLPLLPQAPALAPHGQLALGAA